ncbi:SagB family peptide dehydrogenase [Loktanella sp. SALINAS62]|uniref:SagB family peptide dehydrogenase n=1 Tax=Loktanella sp. SALINAS62 TaxID=2706124 RepID=UPI001B8D9D41|nr:SagB family peptide dehydrogenase [Loktanella sp. SALINAS62]MBS1302060.1 SagB/ThcOx family dehydrogenase [Loktanella sp. SALINAS62]
MFLYLTPPPLLARTAPGQSDPQAVASQALAAYGVDVPKTAIKLAEALSQPVTRGDLDTIVLEGIASGEPMAAVTLERVLTVLSQSMMLSYASGESEDDDMLLRFAPVAPSLPLPARVPTSDMVFRLSRFAQIRVDETGRGPGQANPEGGLTMESPLARFRVHFARGGRGTTAMRAIALLGSGASLADFARSRIPATEREAFFVLLAEAGFILPVDDDGLTVEDRDPVKRQWEVHDLAFHLRSRLGYHDQRIGGDFRFKGLLDPTEAVRPDPPHTARIPLPAPDPAELAATDPGLSTVIAARSSKRPVARRALTLPELGVFLWRTARIIAVHETDLGTFTARPYPSGGGSYEQDVWITVRDVAGLQPGFYFYSAGSHELLLVTNWNSDCDTLIAQAAQAMAQATIPDCVLTLGARFQRMQWKYSGMAYATQLKNAGAIYMAFYLAATAMGLSACGMGLGSLALFHRLSGTDPLREGSIGEFALSGPGG